MRLQCNLILVVIFYNAIGLLSVQGENSEYTDEVKPLPPPPIFKIGRQEENGGKNDILKPSLFSPALNPEPDQVNVFNNESKKPVPQSPTLIEGLTTSNTRAQQNTSQNNTTFQPLLLTPLLDEGRFQDAQNMSTTRIGNLTSYSGYFTVNAICGNHLFFWFFPSSEEDWEKAPVLLWLNGGPGASSLFGMFEEIGPWRVIDGKLVKNEYAWTKDHNVIFIDQPVGTGFSFTEKQCYAGNINVVAHEVYSALVQFFTMFPRLQQNKLFLTGESHAGHYLPAIAVEIDKRNRRAGLSLNLIGILVGNPLIDVRCIRMANFLYELGIIDSQERAEMQKPLLEFDIAVKTQNYFKAYKLYIEMLGFGVVEKVKIPSVYNILYDRKMSETFSSYVIKDEIRREIHVGQIPYSRISVTAGRHLWLDRYMSQAPDIEYLLSTGNYTVGFYLGQLDARVPYTSLPCVLRGLKWPGSQQYLAASRNQWYVSDRLAGWFKTAGNLYEVVVRNSGHFAPRDQGEAVLDLVRAVVDDGPGGTLLTKLNTTNYATMTEHN